MFSEEKLALLVLAQCGEFGDRVKRLMGTAWECYSEKSRTYLKYTISTNSDSEFL